MNKSLKKIWNVISGILVALVVILALLLVLRKPIERSEAVHRASGEEAAP